MALLMLPAGDRQERQYTIWKDSRTSTDGSMTPGAGTPVISVPTPCRKVATPCRTPPAVVQSGISCRKHPAGTHPPPSRPPCYAPPRAGCAATQVDPFYLRETTPKRFASSTPKASNSCTNEGTPCPCKATVSPPRPPGYSKPPKAPRAVHPESQHAQENCVPNTYANNFGGYNKLVTPQMMICCGTPPPKPTCNTVALEVSPKKHNDPFHLHDVSPISKSPIGYNSNDENPPSMCCAPQSNQMLRGSNRICAPISTQLSVSVVAPGAGTYLNSPVYAELGQRPGFSVKILGQARAPYDRYPASWNDNGAPPPNLETFALDLLAQNCLDNTDCIVVGSRGGQVVLPTLWHARGNDVPAAIVVNGGCAMNLPMQVRWPESASTFLLLGGNDYFRGPLAVGDYFTDAQRRVPKTNKSTAILFVQEMTHMPQAQLLNAVLHTMIRAMTSWRTSGDVPREYLSTIVANLRKGRWSGKLSLKTTLGDTWETHTFP